MTLSERLQEDVKDAMRAGDALRRDALRMALAAIKNLAIERGGELSQADEEQVVSKAVKMRLDSAQQFEEAGRGELAQKETAEAELLKQYLPSVLDEAATRTLVEGLVKELGLSEKRELGQLMKVVMQRHRSEVDGKLVQALAAELLS